MHAHVVGIAEQLWRDQSPTRARMQRNLEAYEGFKLPGLDPTAYQKGAALYSEDYDAFYWNVPRALVHSVTAKIAGRQRPKPALVCTDADWATKRRAKRLERFAEATLHQPQGQFRDSWELGTRTFVDACVFGSGIIKAFADLENLRIAHERTLPWELLVDPLEAKYGNPLNCFHRYGYDKDRLIAKFPKYRDKIWACKSDDREHWGQGRRAADCALVYESWRLPISKKDKGRWALCIEGQTLDSEEWARDEFPFLILRWAPHLLGFGSTSLVEEAMPTADELNATIQKMREGEARLATGYLVVEEGAVDDEKIAAADVGTVIKHRPGSKAPEVVQPQGYSESTLGWMRLNWEKSFELTGVSQMAATSRKEPGVTAGVALRTIAQMESERFSLIYAAYEAALAVDLTRHDIACARDVAEAEPEFAARWPGGRFLKEIRWSEADLDDDQYVVQPEAVSGLVNTPADRMQLGQDLFNAGTISQAAFLRIIQVKDVEGEISAQGVQHELVDRYIESWLDATQEDEAEGEFRFRAPVPFMNHADAIIQVASAYMQAELDGAPDWNLDLFTRFIAACDAHIQRAASAAAPPQAANPLTPPGAPMPPAAPGAAQMVN